MYEVMKKILLILSALILGFLILILIVGKTTIKSKNENIGKQFYESDFYKEYYNSDNLILINVWSTTCAPCIAEFPLFEKIKNTNNFKFIFISTDEDSVKLKKFLYKNVTISERDITMKNFNERDSIYNQIQLSGSNNKLGILKFSTKIIPYTVLIKNKKIIYKANDDLDIIKLQKLIEENK